MAGLSGHPRASGDSDVRITRPFGPIRKVGQYDTITTVTSDHKLVENIET